MACPSLEFDSNQMTGRRRTGVSPEKSGSDAGAAGQHSPRNPAAMHLSDRRYTFPTSLQRTRADRARGELPQRSQPSCSAFCPHCNEPELSLAGDAELFRRSNVSFQLRFFARSEGLVAIAMSEQLLMQLSDGIDGLREDESIRHQWMKQWSLLRERMCNWKEQEVEFITGSWSETVAHDMFAEMPFQALRRTCSNLGKEEIIEVNMFKRSKVWDQEFEHNLMHDNLLNQVARGTDTNLEHKLNGNQFWDADLQLGVDSHDLMQRIAHGVGDQMQHKHVGVVPDVSCVFDEMPGEVIWDKEISDQLFDEKSVPEVIWDEEPQQFNGEMGDLLECTQATLMAPIMPNGDVESVLMNFLVRWCGMSWYKKLSHLICLLFSMFTRV
jgi:hypothetical protein